MARPTKATKMDRNKLRELMTEQIARAVEGRGFVEYMFKTLDEIPNPKDRLHYIIEITKFVVPQLASQRIEVENTDTPVTQIVFRPAPTAVAPPKALNE